MMEWRWDISDSEFRVELNPLSWCVGIMLGPLGTRMDIGPLAIGMVWGPRFSSEEHERMALKMLKRKYEE